MLGEPQDPHAKPARGAPGEKPKSGLGIRRADLKFGHYIWAGLKSSTYAQKTLERAGSGGKCNKMTGGIWGDYG
jgi:hypothetical protein